MFHLFFFRRRSRVLPRGSGRWWQLGGVDGRLGLVALALSASGLVYIAQREGYVDHAYHDPVHGAAVPTIGWGSTRGVKPGDTIEPTRALVRLREDAARAERDLRQCLPDVPLHPHEWDAFVALAHNTGAAAVCQRRPGRAGSGDSTIVRRLRALDYAGACRAILLYDRAGVVRQPSDRCSHPDNRSCRGLWADRQRLYHMCMGQAASGAGGA